MKESNKISLINGNTLEIHYSFNDDSHTMDAVIQNKCEYEFLGILKEISSIFNVEILIETEPLTDGGLRRWFKIISKEENNKATITTAIIVALVTGVITTPITTTISNVTEKIIENVSKDDEIKELKKEKLNLEIENLKLEIQQKTPLLNQNNIVKKKRSNFYEALDKYPKVEKVSFIIENISKIHITEEKTVYRNDFSKYILVSDYLEPVEIDNAVIEIISPVLKKGNFKWMGIYKGDLITFNMKSKEFKTLVQAGKIQFKNGTAINCFLTIKKKIDNEGFEKTVGYDVLRVNEYFENEKPIETPEGKYHRQKNEAEKQQLNLFSDLNY
jgi:hypothetical protein